MKNMRFYFSTALFVLVLQSAIGEYQYAIGKEYNIRSSEKQGITCVTKIRQDTNGVAFVTFTKEKSLPADKVTFVVLAPAGEVTAKLSTTLSVEEQKAQSEIPGIILWIYLRLD